MKDQLQEKLTQNSFYTEEQLNWCLANIGHPNPDIRDGLIYTTFYHAFDKDLLSRDQFLRLEQYLQERNLLTSPDTLTRSFSALLASLLIFFDNCPDSPYFSLLENSRASLFNQALTFLINETDTRGYDNELGWIHAIAHGAELVMAISQHQDFSEERLEEVWQIVTQVLGKQESVFSAGEADRLAIIFTQLVLSEKLKQSDLAKWISELDILDNSPEEYFCSLNFKAFLTHIYMTLEKEGVLTSALKHSILSKY